KRRTSAKTQTYLHCPQPRPRQQPRHCPSHLPQLLLPLPAWLAIPRSPWLLVLRLLMLLFFLQPFSC
ncbi:hypothetical protein BGX24_009071, partial [Mortierella sp. AD032]